MGFQYHYDYDFPSVEPGIGDAAGSVAGAVIGFMLVFYLLMMAVCVVFYILQSLGLYTVAKRRGIHNPWLAWLPVGNMWILGSVSDQYQYVAKGHVRNRRKILVGLTVAMYIILFVMLGSLFGMILGAAGEMEALAGAGAATMLLTYLALAIVSIVAIVFQYIATYDFYRSCEPDNSVLYLVLSVLFTISMPVFFFVCRKKDEGMPPKKTAQQPQPVIETAVDQTPVDAQPQEEE